MPVFCMVDASQSLCIMFGMSDSFELRNPSKPHNRLCGFFVS